MKIKATIVPHQQGTEEWAQHRAQSLNASELAAAMGLSPYLSRADLIKQKATSIVPEVDAHTQFRFDKGHEVEAAARPLAEEVIGEELYASVFAAEVEGLHLSASLDGHTLLNEVTWEHKQANAALIDSLSSGVIPEQYHPQMEQGQMLTGATRTLFTASNGTRESAVHVWYESRPELRAKIIPTWKQLMADVAAYVPEVKAAPVVAAPVETLPAVSVKVDGALAIVSNLPDFGVALRNFIAKIPEQPNTDQEFADTEAACKALKRAEDALEAAESNALAQLSDVDTMRRFVADFKALARTTRLQREKLVAQRKESMKAEIVASGVSALAKHIRALNAAMPADYMPTVPADFGGAIKGLRTIDSITNAVDTELARVKIAAGEIATRIHTNIGAIDAANAPGLFSDISTLVLKQPDDLAAIIAQRLDADQKRKDAERERIRAEEAARLEREAKAEADRLERERAHAAQVEAQRIAREQAEALQAERIRAEEHAKVMLVENSKAQTAIQEAAQAGEIPKVLADALSETANFLTASSVADAALKTAAKNPDNGARLTLGQLNERLSPISISVAGLSTLGFEPVEQVKASRLYRESDLPAICKAISAHVLAACATEAA